MAVEGWIKLNRSLVNHWLYSFDAPDKTLAWIDLLLHAAFKKTAVKVHGVVVKLDRGQQ